MSVELKTITRGIGVVALLAAGAVAAQISTRIRLVASSIFPSSIRKS